MSIFPRSCGLLSSSSVLSIRATTPKTSQDPSDHSKAVMAVLLLSSSMAGDSLSMVASSNMVLHHRNSTALLLHSSMASSNKVGMDAHRLVLLRVRAGTDSNRVAMGPRRHLPGTEQVSSGFRATGCLQDYTMFMLELKTRSEVGEVCLRPIKACLTHKIASI